MKRYDDFSSSVSRLVCHRETYPGAASHYDDLLAVQHLCP